MTNKSDARRLTLNNGVTLPSIGLGVFQTPPDETAAAVVTALQDGYRHIDTAAAYQNEKSVGDGIRASGVAREEIFIETKVWVSDFGYDETLHAFEKATGKLGFETLDLLILHQPLKSKFDRTIGAYKALEHLLAGGKVRSIGVSNFDLDDLANLAASTDVVPAVNQIELHPYSPKKDLQQRHEELGILTQAWSPIGGITFYRNDDGQQKSTLDEPVLQQIGTAHGKTAAQVMLRWHVQEGRSAIPKSVKPARIAENFDVYEFTLSTDELAQIDALDACASSWELTPEMEDRFLSFAIPEA